MLNLIINLSSIATIVAIAYLHFEEKLPSSAITPLSYAYMILTIYVWVNILFALMPSQNFKYTPKGWVGLISTICGGIMGTMFFSPGIGNLNIIFGIVVCGSLYMILKCCFRTKLVKFPTYHYHYSDVEERVIESVKYED